MMKCDVNKRNDLGAAACTELVEKIKNQENGIIASRMYHSTINIQLSSFRAVATHLMVIVVPSLT